MSLMMMGGRLVWRQWASHSRCTMRQSAFSACALQHVYSTGCYSTATLTSAAATVSLPRSWQHQTAAAPPVCAALALQHCSVRSLHTGHAVRALPPKPGDEDAAGDRVETEVQVDADGSPFKHGGSARPEMETIYTVPNMLTMARMVASPIIGAAVLTGHYDWAVAGFVVAGALDWLDGWVARKFDMTSTLGSLLDPVADKVLVACLVVPMTYQGLLYLPLVALVVTRDVGLVAGAFYHRAVTKPKDVGFFDVAHGASFSIQPSLISKLNTAAQLGWITLALTYAAWGQPPLLAVDAIGALVGVTTVWSGAKYMRDALQASKAWQAQQAQEGGKKKSK